MAVTSRMLQRKGFGREISTKIICLIIVIKLCQVTFGIVASLEVDDCEMPQNVFVGQKTFCLIFM